MLIMRFGTALALIAIVVSPLLMECTMTCHKKELLKKDGIGIQNDVEASCPVKLTSVVTSVHREIYTERVTVRVLMRAEDFCKAPKIEILSEFQQKRESKIIRPFLKKQKVSTFPKCNNKGKEGEAVKCHWGDTPQHGKDSFALWELSYAFLNAEAETIVSASYKSASSNCSVNYTVPDPMPDFYLSGNQSSKSISVTVEPGDKVFARWCYKNNKGPCQAQDSKPITIDPSQSQFALLNVPYLLPCVCVEVYYTNLDSKRDQKCPFRNVSLSDVTDVWRSSEVILHESTVTWCSVCSAVEMKISASLCWKQHKHLCTPVLNSTLEEMEKGSELIYNTTAWDKHPQMCVQFSLQGSHNITCPFDADKPSWEVNIGPGRQSLFLYITSSVPAKFSAQLCVLDKRGCKPVGQVHSVKRERNSADTTINVPLHFLAEKPCVQVWQSHPALHGRRILCPDYTHYRYGLYAVAALVFMGIAALVGILIQRLTKSRAADWLCIQEPVLLVCSSEQSAHISAVCALASILQGELSAKVHMALWAQSSQTQTGTRTGTGVADLGPLPWLYGQWEAVRKARGKVLIIWSPEATMTYVKWREERTNKDMNERKKEDDSKAEKIKVEVEEHLELNGRRLGICKKQKAQGCVKLCDDKDWNIQREPSTVIAPVFKAALACLEGALQECKGQGVALVNFQGLCNSRDIPKAFRGVPRYCLPQDFSGLIQELGGMRRQTETGKFRWHCWPRLLSKVLSIWLAKQLTNRLKTLLPQMQGKKMQGPSVASTLKTTSVKTCSRLKLPLASNTAGPGTAHEHEPLHGSPWRAEIL